MAEQTNNKTPKKLTQVIVKENETFNTFCSNECAECHSADSKEPCDY